MKPEPTSVTVNLAGGKQISFETGKLAKQAHGAAVVRLGENVVLATATANPDPREGIDFLIGYPVNPIIEAAAEADIRTIMVRQERIGLHMCDAVAKVTSADKIGVFVMQHGPGTENAFGGVAQAYGDSSPIVVLPGGYPRRLINVPPNFNAFLNYQHVTKWIEQVELAAEVPNALRRAFTQARNGRPRPALVEIPSDVMGEEVPEPLEYRPSPHVRSAPDPRDVEQAARVLVEAERPVIYAGQGVHYARAWEPLRELAELLEAPVTTSLQGKSAFPENHPLSLGSGGRSVPRPVYDFLQRADVIFGIGCSFATTSYGLAMPKTKEMGHATLDPHDLNKDVPADYALIGDAGLTLEALVAACKERLGKGKRGRAEAVAKEIKAMREEWLQQWLAKLTAQETPLSPYRVIWDLLHTVDVGGKTRHDHSPVYEDVGRVVGDRLDHHFTANAVRLSNAPDDYVLGRRHVTPLAPLGRSRLMNPVTAPLDPFAQQRLGTRVARAAVPLFATASARCRSAAHQPPANSSPAPPPR